MTNPVKMLKCYIKLLSTRHLPQKRYDVIHIRILRAAIAVVSVIGICTVPEPARPVDSDTHLGTLRFYSHSIVLTYWSSQVVVGYAKKPGEFGCPQPAPPESVILWLISRALRSRIGIIVGIGQEMGRGLVVLDFPRCFNIIGMRNGDRRSLRQARM